MGVTAAATDSVGGHVASQITGGSIELYLGNAIKGTMTGITAANSSGLITVTSASNGTVNEAATSIDRFIIKAASGATPWFDYRNRAFTVVPGDQSVAADTLTIVGHGLTNNQKVFLSGELPTFGTVVSANQPFVVRVSDVDNIQLLTRSGGTPLDITAQPSSDTIITLSPLAVGDQNSGALVRLNQVGTALANGGSFSLNPFQIQAPRHLIEFTS